MSQPSATRISLFLIAALVTGMLPPHVRTETRAVQTVQFDFDSNLARPVNCQPAAQSAATPVSAKPKPTKTSAKTTPPAAGKQLAGTTCGYAVRVTQQTTARRALNSTPQFRYARFTHTPLPQEDKRPAVGIPVKFSLSNPALGTLSTTEVITDSDGVAEVFVTASVDRNRGLLIATTGNARKEIPLEVVRPFPVKWLLTLGLLAVVAGVVTVVVTQKDSIKPLPPPVIP